MTMYLIFDLVVISCSSRSSLNFCPTRKSNGVMPGSRDHDCAVFCDAKWVLGLYLGSGKAGAAYGAASSLITLLLWICYSSQILLFGAEFTQVYVDRAGHGVSPDQHAVRVETKEVENQRSESSENDRRRSAIALAEITVIQPI
jgi:hypothetical protein